MRWSSSLCRQHPAKQGAFASAGSQQCRRDALKRRMLAERGVAVIVVPYHVEDWHLDAFLSIELGKHL